MLARLFGQGWQIHGANSTGRIHKAAEWVHCGREKVGTVAATRRRHVCFFP